MSLSEHDSARKLQSVSNRAFLPTPKKIRFVSSDGQPHAKRRRINAACLTCRKRKTRCSGERPDCGTCTNNGHVCAGYVKRPLRKPHEKFFREEDDDNIDDGGEDDSGNTTPRRQKLFPGIEDDSEELPRSSLLNSKTGMSENNLEGNRKEDVVLRSPESSHTVGSGMAFRHRVPFFRYFGPTAIVPGFKQMVVQVKDRDHRRSVQSVSSESPGLAALPQGSSVGREASPQEVLFYDATDPAPNAPLITHLCETFFTHLGCNYPFLQRDRFMKDLEEKRVDAILVDAVCAIAARFSSDPSLSRPSDQSMPLEENGQLKRAFRGQSYAQKAASSLVDTFGCPTIAVAQACLLLAYEEFGTDRDSGLWMFLGTSIRMAQDLGIQKLEGMQLEGRTGPAPKTVKESPDTGKNEETKRETQQTKLMQTLIERADGENLDDRRASELERIDTFWAIFFLDRAVSSGVGRPVTLRDTDIEISFPHKPNEAMVNGHPHPFPVMIRIVHLYGRIADVINNIQGTSQVNAEGLEKLTVMEKDLTGIYQKMSLKLHFNATNFQHYVKAQQGTNFILLHFWFHTSIILLHQPTLLHSLDSRVQQLFPDSRELSMSSAKTIADILAFAELIDLKSFIGNPFTSQPMYVAACAFLAEARAHASQPTSRQTSPPNKHKSILPNITMVDDAKGLTDSRTAAKHSLLATAANQNYQRCYKALKLLDSYWAGCRYILTALDQKSKGLLDPILFTQEDIDGEMPSIEPSFTQPGWRRSSHGRSPADQRTSVPWSPRMDWSQAIGWSLTGTTNSPAPNLSFLYPNPTPDSNKSNQVDIQAKLQPSKRGQPEDNVRPEVLPFNANEDRGMIPPLRHRVGSLPYDPVAAAGADLLLGLHSPHLMTSNDLQSQQQARTFSTSTFDYATGHAPHLQHQQLYYSPPANSAQIPGLTDMLIESQDIEMSHEVFPGNGQLETSFPGRDMIWLEYLPQDVLSYFSLGDPNQAQMGVQVDQSTMFMPSGHGPAEQQ